MGQLGSFGDIVFEVSSTRIRTMNNFSRSAADRWANHEILGKYPASEFVGPGLDQARFSIRFDVNFGINPRAECDRLRIMSRDGQVEHLIIGGRALGAHKWKIVSFDQRWTKIDGSGNVLVAEVDITLEEYV